jgi:Cu-Zn family superoxide dismutase
MFALGLGTVFYVKVEGVNLAAEGQRFGAHLHAGPCVPDNGAAALGHYNTDVLANTSPVEVSQKTEVWLDFRVSDIGEGRSTAPVPFVPAAGERSIVIHAQPTMDNGSAGARIACLPFTIE